MSKVSNETCINVYIRHLLMKLTGTGLDTLVIIISDLREKKT